MSTQPKVIAFPSVCPCLQVQQIDGSRKIIDHWHPVTTGDWATDCAQGRIYGENVVRYIRENDAPTLLPAMLKAMISAATVDGVVVGFIQALAERIL